MKVRVITIIASILILGMFGFYQNANANPLSPVPDFSQHAVSGWTNYCAPTAGADVAYYLSTIHFTTKFPFGPGVAEDQKASDIIAGRTGFPITGSLADRMSTSLTGGTTPTNLRDGLDQFLEAHDNNPVIAWDTQLIFSSTLGGADFLKRIQVEIDSGNGVILLVDWFNPNTGAPDPPIDPDPDNPEFSYDLPNEPGTGANQPLSHAVTMVGHAPDIANLPVLVILDPGNNITPSGGVHNWPVVTHDKYTVTVNQNDLTFTILSKTAHVYGAIITKAVPVVATPGNIGATPTALTYGNQQTGTTSTLQVVTVSNSGPGDLNIASVFSGPDSSNFSLDPTSSCISTLTLTPLESCTYNVTFTPTSIGPKTAALDILSNDAETPLIQVDLSGSGIESDDDLEAVTTQLQQIIDDNLVTPLADKIEDAKAKADTALEELNKSPPDNQAAIGNIEGAIGDIQAVVDSGDLDPATGNDLMDDLAGIARQLAVTAIGDAITAGGAPDEISEAQQSLADGDALRASGDYKDTANKYKDAVAKAESALP